VSPATFAITTSSKTNRGRLVAHLWARNSGLFLRKYGEHFSYRATGGKEVWVNGKLRSYTRPTVTRTAELSDDPAAPD
jgi:phage repressor protein C with HTH and peptisase S24 domain